MEENPLFYPPEYGEHKCDQRALEKLLSSLLLDEL